MPMGVGGQASQNPKWGRDLRGQVLARAGPEAIPPDPVTLVCLTEDKAPCPHTSCLGKSLEKRPFWIVSFKPALLVEGFWMEDTIPKP